MATEAAQKARDGHFQVACARVFEGLFGEAPDAGVTHPNAYFAEGMEIVARASAVPPTPVGSAAPDATPAATPSTVAATPLAMHGFMRTPIDVTPAGSGAVTPVLGGCRSGTGALSPEFGGTEETRSFTGMTEDRSMVSASPIVGLQMDAAAATVLAKAPGLPEASD
jgi:hypothetical protein